MRFANMMVASRDPIQVDVERWEAVMKTLCHRRPHPLLGWRGGPRGARAASTTRVSAVDKPDSSADDWASAETRQHILTRTEGLRVVTDDNMELEWPPRLTALKVDR